MLPLEWTLYRGAPTGYLRWIFMQWYCFGELAALFNLKACTNSQNLSGLIGCACWL
jgi:hypothetical protein